MKNLREITKKKPPSIDIERLLKKGGHTISCALQ
jgi:hypothetical protein